MAKLVKLTALEQALAAEGFKLEGAAGGKGAKASGKPRKPMSEATKAKIRAGIKRAKAARAKGGN